LTELAESIALFNNNRSFLGEPETLLQQAVALDDTNQKALWLYGMIFYEKKDFVKTNELWTKLYGLLDNDNAKAQLKEQLNDVQSKLGIVSTTPIESAPVSTNTENNDSDIFQLNVNISYDGDALPPLEVRRATLYLYTKAPTGMPMPIAVVQKPLQVITGAFPMQLTLSDLNNLQPTRKLSEFESVVIGARISFTGNATPSPGDLQTTEIKIDLPYSSDINLVIDKVKQ
jgi:cytochrome c-type biogenesis protein CcmH